MSYHSPINAMPELLFVEPVLARVREPDITLLALLTKPSPLTAEEWAYVEAIEARAGADGSPERPSPGGFQSGSFPDR
jgi:hypothetical protein